jgi:PAS domain S-box-containing protein
LWPGTPKGKTVAGNGDPPSRQTMQQPLPAELLQAIFEASLDAIVVANDHGKYVYVNDAMCRLMAATSGQLIGRTIADFTPEGSAVEAWRGFLREGAQRGTITLRRLDGELITAEFAAVAAVQPGYHVSILRDITARLAAEDALRRKEREFDHLLDHTTDLVFTTDLDGRLTSVNSAVTQLLGRPREDLIGLDAPGLTRGTPGHERGADAFAQKLAGSVSSTSYELTLPVGGDRRVVEVETWLLYGPDGQPAGVQGVGRDVTEHRRLVAALREDEARIRDIIDALSVGVWLFDGSAITFANRALEEITGRSREELLVPGGLAMILHPADRQWVLDRGQARLRGEPAPERYELRILHPDGGIRWLDIAARVVDLGGSPVVLACVTDVTSRKRDEAARHELEERLLQAQKLESLGILAGGIAHEFNNLLAAILGNASLALLDLPPDSPLRPLIEAIDSSAQRAADLTRQMLAYSGKGAFVVEQVDLSALVAGMLHLFDVAVNRRATVVTDLASAVPPTRGDPSQLRQVVMNLVTNASDAIGEDGGVIAIATGVTTLAAGDPVHPYSTEDFAPGDYVFLEVADTGHGMDDETLARAFDPFFTTRFTGRGLGLAAVLGIIRGHNGAMIVDSQPGVGTRFRVLFPVAPVEDPAPRPPAPALPRLAGAPTVLVADDEEGIRSIARAALTAMGARVILCSDGAEAISALQAAPGDIALVLLDLTMPVMDGAQVLRELHRIAPGLPVVLMSGYTDAVSQVQEERLAGFLQKPFRVADLARAVEVALVG